MCWGPLARSWQFCLGCKIGFMQTTKWTVQPFKERRVVVASFYRGNSDRDDKSSWQKICAKVLLHEGNSKRILQRSRSQVSSGLLPLSHCHASLGRLAKGALKWKEAFDLVVRAPRWANGFQPTAPAESNATPRQKKHRLLMELLG